MREFFRGWKRKLGVVALVMACLFTAGWMRSRLYEDVAKIVYDENTLFLIGSTKHGIVLSSTQFSGKNFKWPGVTTSAWKSRIPQQRFTVNGMLLGWSLCQIFDTFEYGPDEDPAQMAQLIVWHRTFGGFNLSRARLPPFIEVSTCIVPYWSIVIPLTALSAWLLLNKRKAPT